jgi:ABC-type branched-subunit amino acid transport system ATPase component
MVALARTLQGHPRLVLLDEPTRGLSDAMSEAVAQRIRESRQAGATVMLVEHNTAWAATVANRVVALEAGQFVAVVELSARGNTDEVRQKLSRY